MKGFKDDCLPSVLARNLAMGVTGTWLYAASSPVLNGLLLPFFAEAPWADDDDE
jgi:hypothetical protein